MSLTSIFSCLAHNKELTQKLENQKILKTIDGHVYMVYATSAFCARICQVIKNCFNYERITLTFNYEWLGTEMFLPFFIRWETLFPIL